MAADTLNRLMQNRDAIRKIMSMDSNGSMDTMLENAVKSGAVSYSDSGVNFAGASNYRDNGKVVVNEETMKKSRMPKQILESFKNNPGMSTEMPTSVLDSLELKSLDELRQGSITENAQLQPMQQSGSVIDYSLLRTIINEAVQENVKKYMSALSKKLINEGVSVGSGNNDLVQAVKLGKNFSFITENGDVYEATLKYKTNLGTKPEKKNKK